MSVMNIMNTDEVTTQETVIPFENVAEVPTTDINVSHALKPSKTSKGSRSFTQEERVTIVELAKEVGAPKAAHELGINVKMIYYWAHQEKQKQKLLSSQSEQASTAPLALSLSASPAEIDTGTNQTQDTQDVMQDSEQEPIESRPEEITQNDNIQNERAVEDIQTVQHPDAPQADQAQSTVPSNVLNLSSQHDGNQALLIENAVLKEKVATLTEELARVKAAMLNLMSLDVTL